MARQKIEVEIKIVGTQAQVKIKQLDDAFRDAATGAKTMEQAIKSNSKALKGSVADLQRQIRALELVRDNTAKTTKQFFKQDKQIQQLRNRVKVITDETSKYGRANQDLISSAGLAGATLTEFGRTISDAPYGIRGVTNNLSQLSTLMVTLMAKTGGTTKAFELLGAQLRGPLGIILAFQAVIAAIDFFFGSTKKAEEATDDFTDSLNVNLEVTRIYLEALENTNDSLEERSRLLRGASTRHSALKKILADETLTQEQRTEKAQKFLDLEFSRLALNDEMLSQQEHLFDAEANLSEQKSKLNDLTKESEELKNREGVSASYVFFQNEALKEQTKETNKAQKEFNDTRHVFLELSNQLAIVEKQQVELTKQVKKGKDDETKSQLDLNAAIFEGLNFYTKYNELQERQRDIQKIRRNIEIANIKKILAQEILGLKERSTSREQFEKDKKKLIDDAIKKEIDSIQLTLDLDTLSVLEREKLYERLYKLKASLIDLDVETEDGLNKVIDAAKKAAKFLSFGIDAITAQIDAEISQEERKTMLVNNELKKRIINEKLTADQKEAINNQIEKNEIALQEKRDKLAEKAFKTQKALSITSALIGTAEMAIDAFGTIKGMKFLGPAALPLAIAAAATATAFGLKQVDAIRKTQFVPSAAPGSTRVSGLGGAATGTGGGTQDPAFNIVGTGQQFQLSQAIAQRTGEPVRAYVVTSDVRSGISLERNIIKGSKLG